jgi:tRNA 2-thiouridine synthesizing protein A
VKTSKAVREMASGELVEVFATDPGSAQDFSAWCRSTGNALVEQSRDDDGVFRYVIRKR